MTIAAVMVYVDPGQQAEGHVCVARDLAGKFGASLIGVSAAAVEPPFVAEGVIIQETTAVDLERLRTALADKEQWFRRVSGLPAERVAWRWRVEYPTGFLVNEARSADLVVIRRTQPKIDAVHLIDPAEAMMRMGRPTLMVPDHVAVLKADRILLGWKDTREARLAVRDALPFLTKAAQVSIVEICRSDEQDAARRRVRDVASYLRLHGVTPEIDVRVHMADADAHHLAHIAAEQGADLIVTGGYGHSRLGEWMFGGVTRGLLNDASICVMMSH